MANRIAGPDLEIPDAADFLRREWLFERIGWLVVVAALAAAIAGVLGAGPASWASRTAGDVEVEYPRITHRQTEDEVSIRFPARGEPVAVQIRGDWVESAVVRGLSPEPSEQVAAPDGLLVVLPTAGTGEATLTVSFQIDRAGPVSGEVVVDGRAVPFQQLVLP